MHDDTPIETSEREALPWSPEQAASIAAAPKLAEAQPHMVQALKDAIEGECDGLSITDAHAKAILEYVLAAPSAQAEAQPRLTVRLCSFPESSGKRNWTALLVRTKKWGGLVGSCGGITVARGEYWNRVAYEAERAKLLIGERDTEPSILDYGDDIQTPEEWAGEVRGGRPARGVKLEGGE